MWSQKASKSGPPSVVRAFTDTLGGLSAYLISVIVWTFSVPIDRLSASVGSAFLNAFTDTVKFQRAFRNAIVFPGPFDF
jgi:hypothetical protein